MTYTFISVFCQVLRKCNKIVFILVGLASWPVLSYSSPNDLVTFGNKSFSVIPRVDINEIPVITNGKKTSIDSVGQRSEVFTLSQGVDFSTSEAVDDKDRLLEEANYFVKLQYNAVLAGYNKSGFSIENWSLGAAVDFRQTFVVTNDISSVTTNQPSTSDITKADAIGMTISPCLDFYSSTNTLGYARLDLGAVVAQSSKENIDESFNFESAAVIGLDRFAGATVFRLEGGIAYYGRLPQDKWRSIARVLYGYKVTGGAIGLSTEFSGLEYDESGEAKVQIIYEVEPSVLFNALGALFLKQ